MNSKNKISTLRKLPFRNLRMKYLQLNFSILLLMLGFFMLPSVKSADNNLRFFGTLVEEACTLRPGDEEQRLDFGTVVDKYLYSYVRTQGQLMSLHLDDCDASSPSVSLTFSGPQNIALPGYLNLGAGSTASGVAIGLETEGGTLIPLDSAQRHSLSGLNNELIFKVFIRAEPSALQNRNIGKGTINAVATFSLEYE